MSGPSLESRMKKGNIVLSRRDYQNQLYGFWLGQCIANWTCLVIEMDKIGITIQQKLSTPYTQVRYASFTENDFVRNFYVKQLPCTVNRRNLVVETT